MAKFSPKSKLSLEEREQLLVYFFEALAVIKNSTEAAKVFSDILSDQELDMLAKRLAIARELLNGRNYQDISRDLKVGMNTIARINAWIRESGEGFRLVFSRLSKTHPQKATTTSSIRGSKFKRAYPQYFWPEAVLEQIILSATRKKREALISVIRRSKQKTRLIRQINYILKKSKFSHTI
jgi:TrpR-related protein YerC/YecD